VNDHETERVAGNGALGGIVDVMETGPLLDEQHQGTHPPIHCNVIFHFAFMGVS